MIHTKTCRPHMKKMTGDNLKIKKRKIKYRDAAKLLKGDDENE